MLLGTRTSVVLECYSNSVAPAYIEKGSFWFVDHLEVEFACCASVVWKYAFTFWERPLPAIAHAATGKACLPERIVVEWIWGGTLLYWSPLPRTQGEVGKWLRMGVPPDRICRKLGKRSPVSLGNDGCDASSISPFGAYTPLRLQE